MSLWFSYYTLMVTCIFIPVAWSKIMLAELLTIQNSRKFNRKWSALYEGIKTKSKVTIAFYFIYYLRRLFFCILVITNTEITMLKVQVVMLSNLFIMIYQANFKPFIIRKQNRIELFNECCIIVITFHMLCFSDWVPHSEIQQKVGISMISLSVFKTVINFGNIILIGCWAIILIFIRYWRRLRRKINPFYGKLDHKDPSI